VIRRTRGGLLLYKNALPTIDRAGPPDGPDSRAESRSGEHQANRREIGRGEICCCATGSAKSAATKSAAAQPAATKSAATKPGASKAAARPASAAPVVLTTDAEKSIYALGLSVYKSLGQFDLSPHEFEILKRALADAAAHKPAVDLNEWGPKIGPLARERSARVTAQQKVAAKAYLEKAAAEPGAVRAESGLIYREVKMGSGNSRKRPTP